MITQRNIRCLPNNCETKTSGMPHFNPYCSVRSFEGSRRLSLFVDFFIQSKEKNQTIDPEYKEQVSPNEVKNRVPPSLKISLEKVSTITRKPRWSCSPSVSRFESLAGRNYAATGNPGTILFPRPRWKIAAYFSRELPSGNFIRDPPFFRAAL